MVQLELDGARALVMRCLDSGWVSSQGPAVREFEEAFARYVGAKHAISCSSGTAALHLALKAVGIGPGDEVIVPSFTFIATANAVTYCGATPVFCDVDPETWCIDWKGAFCNRNTKAVVVVHINGYPAEIAKPQGVRVVEDACQALGSVAGGGKLGTLGDIGCFSFFANKQLTTGEGGMCVTDDPELAHELALYRDQGRVSRDFYIHNVVGFNYRMVSLQAALGLAQLPGLDERIRRRRATFRRWEDALGRHQPLASGQSPWMYQLRVEQEWQMAEALLVLGEVGIEAKPFFRPCHLQIPYWSGIRLPVSEGMFGIMLPLHKGVTDRHIGLAKMSLEKADLI